MEPERGKKASLRSVAGTVFWSFFGIRRRSAHESAKPSPVQILVAGVVGAAILVVILVALVKFIVASAG
jgi:hypothetical protein